MLILYPSRYKREGTRVNENHVRAYQWYKKAAAQGSEYGKIKAKEFELFKFYK